MAVLELAKPRIPREEIKSSITISRVLTLAWQGVWDKVGKGEIYIFVRDEFPGTYRDMAKYSRTDEVVFYYPHHLVETQTAPFLVKLLGGDKESIEIASRVSNTACHPGYRRVYVGNGIHDRLPYGGLDDDEVRLALQADGRDGLNFNEALIASYVNQRFLKGNPLNTWYTRIIDSKIDGRPFIMGFEKDGRFKIFQPEDPRAFGLRYSAPIPEFIPILTTKPGLHIIDNNE